MHHLDRYILSLNRSIFRIWTLAGFILLLSPLAIVFWMSLFLNEIPSVPPTGYTLNWYAEAIKRPQFYDSFLFSFQVALIAAALGLAVSVPATIALRSARSWWSAVMGSCLRQAPLVASSLRSSQ